MVKFQCGGIIETEDLFSSVFYKTNSAFEGSKQFTIEGSKQFTINHMQTSKVHSSLRDLSHDVVKGSKGIADIDKIN